MQPSNPMLNVNTLCTVQLTDYGMEHVQKKAPQIFMTSGWRGDTRTLTAELWYLMHIFGECFWMGNKIPFVKNDIEIMEALMPKK